MIMDTMVFAYASLKVDGKYEEALAVLEKADKILVPDSFRAEFTNVVWQWVKFKDLSEEVAYNALQNVGTSIDRVVSSEEGWVRALQISIESDHPAYDTIFIATAMMHNQKVITYDRKMQSKFSDWVFISSSVSIFLRLLKEAKGLS